MPDVTSQDCWMKLNSRMCEFANSKIPIKQQSLDLFIVEALYFYPLTTIDLFSRFHILPPIRMIAVLLAYSDGIKAAFIRTA